MPKKEKVMPIYTYEVAKTKGDAATHFGVQNALPLHYCERRVLQ